ncbi:threonine/serine dehydratase [Phytohabitans rumicis]|uniref:Serine/threonine dehydratase n=1 Tax=Phytohabitans rumicis TaxID=1076125 RepID=A0A6V8L992_9ACTN|nr:threonine/serine dehydratase [Phytohabitans rumicis]GFJ92180.1 serine/threonine dehydratase [Phytohabitans rumicis]
MIGHDDLTLAAKRIAPYVRRTPVLEATVDGRPVTLKLEHLQLTGSFKVRGALNALLSGAPTDRVVTASGGNHGLGVATAARLLGVRATIYVPENVPPDKERRIAATGADVVRHGSRYAEAERAARGYAEEAALRYLPAYDDADVVAGQGTVGIEIAEQVPECDAVAVAVGGGGLIAGVSVGVGERTVVGVEPTGCASLHAAIAAGAPTDSPVHSVASSALGATRVGRIPFDVLGATPALRLALVDDVEILAARDRLWDEFRLAVEPAGAVAFAAWLAGRVSGDHACVVVCGANADWRPL